MVILALNLVCLLALVLIFLAPYSASTGCSETAGIIYMVFKPLCHQRASRSFFIWGHQLAVCARCMGVYSGLAFSGVFASALLMARKLKPLPVYLLIFFLIPIAIDGAVQLLGLRESTNIIRLLTGILAGFGVVLFLYPRLWNIEKSKTLGQSAEEVKGG